MHDTTIGREGAQSPLNFTTANLGRDHAIYERGLDAADRAKASALIPHLLVPEGGAIKDAGSGTGRVAEIVARHFSRATVYGVDISHERLEVSNRDRMLMRPVYGDIRHQTFPDGSLDAGYFSTCLHEVRSFWGLAGVREALASTFRELKPGGVLAIRDMVIPTDELVYLRLQSEDGFKPAGLDPMARGDGVDYRALSTDELFDHFARDFQGGNAFVYERLVIDGQPYIKLPAPYAYEFYMRKDYRENYLNEIHETYGVWSRALAAELLEEAGFSDIELHDEHNDWIVKNRLEGKIALFRASPGGALEPIEIYPTHLVVVARKPCGAAPRKDPASPALDLYDAKKTLTRISLDELTGTLDVDGRSFRVDLTSRLRGTKREVFYEIDHPDRVVKIPRLDGENAHNCLKAMYQAISRREVLDELEVPHLRLLDFDRRGPPYLFLEQERLPENAKCAADLILTSDLREEDVQQIAAIVNRTELGQRWQLDTNPYNWYRVTRANGHTQMIYADGKVYPHDPRWSFPRKGLLQWLQPALLPGRSDEVIERCAQIPTEALADSPDLWWDPSQPQVQWWRRHLHPRLLPE